MNSLFLSIDYMYYCIFPAAPRTINRMKVFYPDNRTGPRMRTGRSRAHLRRDHSTVDRALQGSSAEFFLGNVAFLEVGHELNQSVDAGSGHGIIEGGTQAPHHAVAF
jgi:hypothetical protein